MTRRDWDRARQRDAAALARRAGFEMRRNAGAFPARHQGTCEACKHEIAPGELILPTVDKDFQKAWRHQQCRTLVSRRHSGQGS